MYCTTVCYSAQHSHGFQIKEFPKKSAFTQHIPYLLSKKRSLLLLPQQKLPVFWKASSILGYFLNETPTMSR